MSKKTIDRLAMFTRGLSYIDRVVCPKTQEEVIVISCRRCSHLRKIRHGAGEVLCGFKKDIGDSR